MTRQEFYRDIYRLAEPIYGSGEASQIAYMLADEVAGLSRSEMILHPEREIEVEPREVERIKRELTAERPVQYIIGEAEFCDLRLKVREGVLIPRPESEELVRWACELIPQGGEGRAIDIGSGSGALSIALSVARPGYEVTGVDISTEALAIARENGERLAPSVRFIEGNALAGVERSVEGEFDLIISNPPYIPNSEVDTMRPNVTEYEPHLALFVPDDDPLIFYRAIAHSALKLLSKGGYLLFEIHENFAEQTRDMLLEMGYPSASIRLDINDKPRMICAQKEI